MSKLEAEEKEELELALSKQIGEAIQDIAKKREIEGIKSLSCMNPQKVHDILTLMSRGVTKGALSRKYGYSKGTIYRIAADYADHCGKFRELGGKLASDQLMKARHIQDVLAEKFLDHMESPDFVPSAKDLKEVSIWASNSHREAMAARGEATQIIEERRVTIDDAKAAREAALARLEQSKDAEILDIESSDD